MWNQLGGQRTHFVVGTEFAPHILRHKTGVLEGFRIDQQGRHGRFWLIDLCPLLGLNWQRYGWVTKTA